MLNMYMIESVGMNEFNYNSFHKKWNYFIDLLFYTEFAKCMHLKLMKNRSEVKMD